MAVIALSLRESQARHVRECWDRLETKLGLWGVRRVLLPHITLLGCDGVDHPRLQEVLVAFSQSIAPFRLRTAGLGLFLKPKPVLHAPVIRTPGLSELHRALWRAVADLGGGMFDLYSPERWLPHLTLAVGDLTPENLAEAVGILAEMDQELAIEVTNLTLFEWIGPCWEPRERYPLIGEAGVSPPRFWRGGEEAREDHPDALFSSAAHRVPSLAESSASSSQDNREHREADTPASSM